MEVENTKKQNYLRYEYENASNSERLLSGCTGSGFFTLLSLLFLFLNIPEGHKLLRS